MMLYSTHTLSWKFPRKKEFQEIESNHLCDIDFRDFMKVFKDYTKEAYSFLVNDMTLSSHKPLWFGKNLL